MRLDAGEWTMADVDVSRWDAFYSRPLSPTLDAIHRRTLTSAYPAEVQALTIWPTWDLAVVAEHLRAKPGQTVLDIACGGGQLGLWITRKLGAALIGVDPSPVAREQARAAAERAGRADTTILDGHLLSIPVPDASVDALMSIDTIHFATDADATLSEMRRVLRPGGRCVVIGMEPREAEGALRTDGSRPRRWSDAFERSGFSMVTHAETPDWESRFVEAWRAVAEHEATIRTELAAHADGLLEIVPRPEEFAATVRHGMVVAEARG